MNAILCLVALWCGVATAATSTFSFIAMGDWGGRLEAPYTTPAQISVANAMSQVAKRTNAQYVLAIGDNFYDKGVSNVDDPRFNETFESVYTQPSLQCPWLVVCGNHDHVQNCSAQVAYAHRSRRWTMPAFFYTQTRTFNGVTVLFVMIDTVVLAGQWDNHEPQPLGTAHPQLRNAQLQWLERVLSNSTADWILVSGHYPVYSVAEHGPTRELIDNVQPLLEKYGVAAYWSGHDHCVEALVVNNVTYFGVGAAHDIDYSMAHASAVPHGSLKYHFPTSQQQLDDLRVGSDDYTQGAFAGATLHDAQTMTVTFYNQKAESLYSTTVLNARRSSAGHRV